jgi:hypothetical protein
VQVAAPASELNVPGAHGFASSVPVEQNVPASHKTQSSLLVITSRSGLVRVPAGQGSGADDSAAQ